MLLHSKKLALFTVCALSLSTCAPSLHAGDKHSVTIKLTEEQNNKLNTAMKVVGGVVLVAVLGAAVYAVSKGVRDRARLSDSSAHRDESKRGTEKPATHV